MEFSVVFQPEQVTCLNPEEVKWTVLQSIELALGRHVTAYRYLRNMWSLADFLRETKVETLQPLSFACGGFSCNVYWWPILWLTCDYVTSGAVLDGFESEDKVRAVVCQSRIKQAIGLLRKLFDECEPQWTDRGEGAFKELVDATFKKISVTSKFMRACALVQYAWLIRDDEAKCMERASCHRTTWDSSGKKDLFNTPARKALLEKSRHHQYLGQFAQAIACARAYEAGTKDLPHPELQEWEKQNENHHKQKLPKEMPTWQQELEAIPVVDYFTKGTPVPGVKLFALKSEKPESKKHQ
jgi:hypothetical protein